MKKIYFLLCLGLALSFNNTQAQCVANYFVSSQSGLTINFIDSSSIPAIGVPNYSWSFGDGNSSTLKNPTHTYSQGGIYTVCLFISVMNCSDSVCYTITLNSPPPCAAFYSYVADTTNTVSFTNHSIPGTGYIYDWDFGDGSANSTAINPTHTYSSAGAYGVTLTAIGPDTCTYYDTVYVNYCNAYFTSQVGSNGVVNFNNYSAAGRSGRADSWNFGDGNFSNQTSPTHTYSTSGTYTVTLSIYDSLNNCSSTFSDSVVVQIGSPSSCNASYTIAKDSAVAYGVILYNNSSNFASHYYSWNFGDGTTGSGRTPIHQYQSFGSYLVCLTITDSILNCTSTFCDTVGMDTLGNLKTSFGIRVVNQTAVGIEENLIDKAINLYPNPAASSIFLDLSDVTQPVNISIMDLSGRVINSISNQASGNIENIDISALKEGLYFMIIEDGTSKKIKKFIKAE